MSNQAKYSPLKLNIKNNLPDNFEIYFGKCFNKCNKAINWLLSHYLQQKNNVNKYILLARNITINTNSIYEYYVFYSNKHFFEFYQLLPFYSRRFYAVYYTMKRSLYLDIDCYQIQLKINFFVLEKQLIFLFNELKIKKKEWIFNLYLKNGWENAFYIYSSRRLDKFSVHILNPLIITAIQFNSGLN